MKTESPLLPDGVAESWFHISCGGEVWTSRVCQGRDLLKVLDELAPGSEHYAADLADKDSWYCLEGRCLSISLACGEDPDIEIALIDDPVFAGFVADKKRVDRLDALLNPRLVCLLAGFSLGVMAVALKVGDRPGILWVLTCAVLLISGLFSK